MPHDHNNEISPSGHPYRKDQDYPLTYWQNLEIAVREILAVSYTHLTLPTNREV